ncbi:hypothetical protein E4T47_09516 [Aureobasidium subglaciale]|nr:hypothetical protein E4T47_09516 [Aureobasidium subglaciale]
MAHGTLNPADDPDYLSRILERDHFKRKLDCLLASMDLDALAFSDVQILPPKHEDATNASQARLPAITIPAGFTEDGLPVGLQLVSWEYHEQALLELTPGYRADH